jgi:hypothetical protein
VVQVLVHSEHFSNASVHVAHVQDIRQGVLETGYDKV